MAYQWTLDPQDLFAERYPQMVNTGLPAGDADAMRASISDMWTDEQGGWVPEWSRLASRYAADGRHDLAVLAYGWAKFPTLADDRKRAALTHQVEQYRLAAPEFPVSFERRDVMVNHRGAITSMPVHLLAAPDLPADAPILLASGGVDSWKMDLHQLFVAFALNTRARVLAFDIPGTGESPVPLSADAHEVLDGLIVIACELGNGRVAHLGISMGGYFSARSGLAGDVDASIVLGGPVEAAFAPDRRWKFGMADIVGNAMGFDDQPTAAELAERMRGLSLRTLLDRDTNAPMLVINGADDVHIPQHDTLVFTGRRDTHVELLSGTGHCAVSELSAVVPKMISWLSEHLSSQPAPC